MTTQEQARVLAGMAVRFAAQLRAADFRDSGIEMMAEGLACEMDTTLEELREILPAAFDVADVSPC